MSKLDVFLPLLSQPLSFAHAGALMGSLPGDIKKRVLAIRQWLLELDPGGDWERRVRLGGGLAELRVSPLHFSEAGAQEDLDLTERLTFAFDQINGQSVSPVPACHYCGNRDARLFAPGKVAFPRFECMGCGRNYSRRTGTVFAKTKRGNLAAMRQSIRYLALPLPFSQVSDELDVLDGSYIERWRDMFVVLADQLEPDGSLSSRIRLGVEPTSTTPCPFCARTGWARRTEAGWWSCAGCGRLFSMRRNVIEREGRLEIVGLQETRSADMSQVQITFQRRAAPQAGAA